MRCHPLNRGDVRENSATNFFASSMRVYLDAGVLFATLVETPGSDEANQILHKAGPPSELNLLHQLQAENFIAKLLTASDVPRQNAGGKARRLRNFGMIHQLRTLDYAKMPREGLSDPKGFASCLRPPALLAHRSGRFYNFRHFPTHFFLDDFDQRDVGCPQLPIVCHQGSAYRSPAGIELSDAA
jgi:hypothetical protein